MLVKNCRNHHIYSNNLCSEILRLKYLDIFLDFFISTHEAEQIKIDHKPLLRQQYYILVAESQLTTEIKWFVRNTMYVKVHYDFCTPDFNYT